MQRFAIPLILAAAATVAASPGLAQGISQDTGARSYGAQNYGAKGGPPTAAAVKTSAGGPAANAGAKAAKPIVKVGVPRGEIKLPQILKSGDVARYRRIFALQASRQYRAADREIAQLSDRILLGHVLFQRYMGRGYRVGYRQLSAWMARYADHPDSARLYKLALRRKPRRAGNPRTPRTVSLGDGGEVAGSNYRGARPVASARALRRTRWLRRSIGRHIAYGRLTRAERILNSRRYQRSLGPALTDLYRTRLAFRLMAHGQTEKAYAMAKAAHERTGARLTFAQWTLGLAAFRLARYEEAATHFEALAQMNGVSDWTESAAAYWAARARLRNRQPEQVNRWIDAAAQHAGTFYGILARRQLGLGTRFNWKVPEGSGADMDRLLESSAAVRAIALVQVGQRALAEQELRRLYRGGDPGLGAALLAVAQAGNMPGLSLRVARLMTRRDGKKIDGGLYPVPKWRPREGFTIDRALVYAVMRQESAFRTRARSHVGARGLMQLMPRTASIVAQDRRLRWRRGRNRLFDPALNISLGQKYLNFLLARDGINGNIIYAVAGYNAGPGAVAKWHTNVDHRNDPLLFLESIPYRETRGYVVRVLANLWAYRERLSQQPASLDQVAAGAWPIYKPQDGRSTAKR
ncbi:MAG TPA: lytic transglycosylase domain-containing protein [Alphaproteobacteria bacterium]|nr:lytic transglycosylase domain-containing protein [Alphaproteobacteria bacterium]